MDVIKQLKIQADCCETLIDLMISEPDTEVTFPKEVQSILSLHKSMLLFEDNSKPILPLEAFKLLDEMIIYQLEWLTQVSVLHLGNDGRFTKEAQGHEPNVKMLHEIEMEDIFYLRNTLDYLIIKKQTL